MKTITCYTLLFLGMLISSAQTITISPTPFAATDQITITITDFDPVASWGVSELYLWTWYFDQSDTFVANSPTNGTWNTSDSAQRFTNNGNGSYSYTFTPATLFNDSAIGRIGFLIKAENGDDGKTADQTAEVGIFQLTRTAPVQSTTILNNGEALPISATTTTPANFELFIGDAVTPIHTQTNTTSYSYSYTVTATTDLKLVATATDTAEELTTNFTVIKAPTVTEAAVPEGMQDGLNIDPNTPTTATFVLYAPHKNFVHLQGNFLNNDWTLDDTFLLHKDSTQDRFWITLINLPTDADILYQYLIDGTIAIADPYAALILSEFNDSEIDATTFPDLPAYPTGKTNHAVTYFRTNAPSYDWKITDFQRPATTDLVIYELLIRDFDALHSFDAVTARLDYLVALGINAIELMPVSEFDGNNSWGYNPSFHMALDKYYGTPTAFKSFVDACHEKGIAVILDVVYNHATGQNPYYRMWNDCNGCYTGTPTAQNPFFNTETPNTSFSFFNDIDHESAATQAYIDRLNTYWLDTYHVDGFRFDFTKGFSNTVGDGEAFDQSRIDLLTRMHTAIRAIDTDAYVILEHLATNEEETKLIEAGMLVWSNLNFNYNQATMGYDDSNFQWISYKNRGWNIPSNIAYMESHDEERLMSKNIRYGNMSNAPTYSVKDLSTALDRVALAGAFYFTVPGPKMIWQFGELGYEFSINRCEDATIDEQCRTNPKPIRWDYVNLPDRKDVYDTYAQLIRLKQQEPIFKTADFTLDVSGITVKKIHLTDPSATGDAIKYVTIIGNFGVTATDITPSFQQTGTWYDLMDPTASPITVADVNAPIQLAAGTFKIYANAQTATLSTPDTAASPYFSIVPNPAKTSFRILQAVQQVQLYSITGQLIKEYTGDFQAGHTYTVDDVSNGLYILQITNENGTNVTKLTID